MSDVDMFESQENDIQKVVTQLSQQDLDDTDIIPATPINNTKKKRCIKKKSKCKHETIVNREKNFEFKIESTKTGCFDFNKPFVYHGLEEVLRYTLNRFPKNNNIHLIGFHRFFSHQGHYLQKNSKENIFISLDFTVATGIPNENEMISVFGSVEFSTHMQFSNASVFIVKFFRREVEIVVKKYIERLLEIRKYVPSDYFLTIS